MGVARRIVLSLVVAAAVLAPAPAGSVALGTTDIVNTVPPALTGEAVFGQKLVTSDGSWTPDGLTFTYTWARDGVRINGETKRSYRLALPDLGHRITATVTATATDGSSLAVTTEPSAKVRKATLTSETAPTISGVLRWTHRLTATSGTWSKRPTTLRYRWLRSGTPIRGARRSSYVLGVDDVGERIRVEVTARREGYHPATAPSAPTRRVGHLVAVKRKVTYSVTTRGKIRASLGVFKRQVQQTYDDPRGWRSAGVEFRRVARGGTFTVVLAQASTVPSFSSACSAEWSCRVGRFVIINQTRWLRSSPSWRQQHLARRDYRHMVVNHETGHWLGHPHAYCSGAGRLAPVMQQQSKGLQGCRHNPWPLAKERWFHLGGRTLPARVAGRALSAWAVAG